MTRALWCCLLAAAWSCAPASEVGDALAALNKVCSTAIHGSDQEEALKLCRKVAFDAEKMAPGSREHVASLINLGDVRASAGNFADAQVQYEAALQFVDRVPAGDGEQLAQLLARLADLRRRSGQFLDAQAPLLRLLQLRERAAGAADPSVAAIRVQYADLLSQARQFPEAEAEYQRALPALEQAGAAGTAARVQALWHLGEMYERQSQYQRAEQQYRILVEVAEHGRAGNELLPAALDLLAYACEAQDRANEAVALYQRELLVLDQSGGTLEQRDAVRARLAALGGAPPPLAGQK